MENSFENLKKNKKKGNKNIKQIQIPWLTLMFKEQRVERRRSRSGWCAAACSLQFTSS